MFDTIKEDIKIQTNNGNTIKKIKNFLNFTFHLLLMYRFGCWCYKNVPIFGRAISFCVEYLIKFYFSSDISCRSKIGPGLNFMHGSDIVIGSAVVAGKCLKIFNGVTLGNKDTETIELMQPTIGNNVIIGSGAKVMGNIKIGNNIKIGANTVVINDLPDNCIAVGVPARVILATK
jgi:serine O-acetyltransferase